MVVGRTGLAADGALDAVETPYGSLLKHTDHYEVGRRTNGAALLGDVFVDDAAGAVLDLRQDDGAVKDAVVAEGGVGAGHLLDGQVDGTEGQGGHRGKVLLGDAHVVGQVADGLRAAELLHEAGGHRIDGVLQAVVEVHVLPGVVVVGVARRPGLLKVKTAVAGVDRHRYVLDLVAGADAAQVDGGGVDQGLEGGAHLPLGRDVVELEPLEVGAPDPAADEAGRRLDRHAADLEDHFVVADAVQRRHRSIRFQLGAVVGEHPHFYRLVKLLVYLFLELGPGGFDVGEGFVLHHLAVGARQVIGDQLAALEVAQHAAVGGFPDHPVDLTVVVVEGEVQLLTDGPQDGRQVAAAQDLVAGRVADVALQALLAVLDARFRFGGRAFVGPGVLVAPVAEEFLLQAPHVLQRLLFGVALQVGVDRGVERQAVAVRVVGLATAFVVALLAQDLLGALLQDHAEVGRHAVVVLLQAVVEAEGQGGELLHLRLTQVAVALHLGENLIAAVFDAFGVAQRVVEGAVLQHPHQHGRLRDGKVRRPLPAEVIFGRGADTLGAVDKIVAVEVHRHDLLLRVLALQAYGDDPLAEFLEKAFHDIGAALATFREQQLCQLLRDGRTTAGSPLSHDSGLHHRPRQSPEINTAVVMVALVLGGDQRVDDVVPQFIVAHHHPVFVVIAAQHAAVGRQDPASLVVLGVFQFLYGGQIGKAQPDEKQDERDRRQENQAPQPDDGAAVARSLNVSQEKIFEL